MAVFKERHLGSFNEPGKQYMLIATLLHSLVNLVLRLQQPMLSGDLTLLSEGNAT